MTRSSRKSIVSMVPGGAHRSTAASVACSIEAPVSLVTAWPMNFSVPSAWHLCPGVTPWIGTDRGGTGLPSDGAGAVAHPATRVAPRSAALRIDTLGFGDPAPLKLAVLDGK